MKTTASLVCLSALVAFAGSQESQTGMSALNRGFQDPQRQNTVRLFWFWNGKLEAKEIERQIQQMVDQGV